MRLEDLKLFITIAECANLRRASERVGLTQPALTKVLRRLETELGVMLFERAPRGLILTDVGGTFLDRIRRMDLQLTHALREVEDIRYGELGLLRIGTTSSYVEGVFSPVMLSFLADRPAAQYRLTVHATVNMLAQLAEGQLDLVLAAVPRTVSPELEYEQLFLEPMHVVGRRGHPLLEASSADVAQLAGVRWLLPPKGRMGRAWLEDRLNELGLPPPRVAIETELTSALLRNLLVHSDLLTTLSQSVLNSQMGDGLATLESLFGRWREPMAIYWRREAYLSPLALEFRRRIVESTSALGNSMR